MVESFSRLRLDENLKKQEENGEKLEQGSDELMRTYLFTQLNPAQTESSRETMAVSSTDVMQPPTSTSKQS